MMQIIILFIPPSATLKELRQFVRSGLGSPWAFWLDRKITACDILDIEDPKTKTGESHGLISVAHPEEAQQIISRLNGREFKGKPVEVREFHNRGPGDKRIGQIADGSQVFLNSRRGELKVHRREGSGKKSKRPGFLKLNDTREATPFLRPKDED
jgi:hypothetical protein